jgi:hypothetical protein
MLELKNGCGFIRDLLKSFFSPVRGGAGLTVCTPFVRGGVC